MNNFINRLKNRWQAIVYISVLLGAIVFSVSAIKSPKYSSNISVLIIQKYTDIFSASRSVEYLSDLFSEVIYFDSFIEETLTTSFQIEKKFPSDQQDKIKAWKRMVKVDNSKKEVGILNIIVTDYSKKEAEKIAAGIGWNFVNNNDSYHGSGKDIDMKIISGPITDNKSTYPNLFVNTSWGMIIGMIISLLLIYFFKNFDLKFLKSEMTRENFDDKEASAKIIQKLKDQFEEKTNAKIFSKYSEEDKENGENLIREEETVRIIEENESEIMKQEVSRKEQVFAKKNSTLTRKATAPDNLPIFEPEKFANKELSEGQSKSLEVDEEGFLDVSKLDNKQDQKKDFSKNKPVEATEDEIKERLNKLLRGEM